MRGIQSSLSVVLAMGLLAASAVGVAAQDEEAKPAAPVEFTGKISCGPCPGAYTTQRMPGKTESRGEY